MDECSREKRFPKKSKCTQNLNEDFKRISYIHHYYLNISWKNMQNIFLFHVNFAKTQNRIEYQNLDGIIFNAQVGYLWA